MVVTEIYAWMPGWLLSRLWANLGARQRKAVLSAVAMQWKGMDKPHEEWTPKGLEGFFSKRCHLDYSEGSRNQTKSRVVGVMEKL